ncbi:MAG: type I methionyl aminopeptidase [Leptonema illini]|uniref:Methionine aminopeptidase n=1 Tax=Leptonema illini TaxID=183 RepID=A0A833LWJ1_9LEPT|nr:MAG: type I methionyl aminopeptidase [Leptonema illini]
MSIDSKEDLDGILAAGRLVADTMRHMVTSIRAGMTTLELDQIGRRYFEERGGRSAPELTYSFPGATCISVNEEAAHGIPGSRILEKGDVINVDVSLELNGYFADMGYTTFIEPVSVDTRRLIDTSRYALDQAIRAARHGAKIAEVGRVIEKSARLRGFKVIRNLAGHGVGRALHEEPVDLVNYYDPGDRRKLRSGQVIALETFVSTGAEQVIQKRDGWTLTTRDNSRVAQFEHTLIVRDGKALVATA